MATSTSSTEYTICVGFYHDSHRAIECSGAAILLFPTTNTDLYTYKWSCVPDNSGQQVWRQARLPRNFKDSSLKAVLKLGVLSDEIHTGLAIFNSVLEYAVGNTDVGQPSDSTCPEWLGYVMKVSH